MRTVRTIVADDEPLALDRLTTLLERIEGVDVVGAFSHAQEVMDSVKSSQPDLLLLDVDMPKLDGFDIVEALSREQPKDSGRVPLVCFVTAYPQFASAAFDSGALDFLCKPVRLQRLEKTIERARSAMDGQEAMVRLRLMSEVLDALRSARSDQQDPFIWVEKRGETVRLDNAALEWIEAEGEYVRVHAGGTSHILRTSMTALCDELAPRRFIRIHRSYAVKIDRLTAIRRSRTGMTVVLESGAALPVGRKYRSQVEAALGGRSSTGA